MSILDRLANITGMDIKKAMDDSYDAMADLFGDRYPKPFETDMTMTYDTVHYIKDGVYVGSRKMPRAVREAAEAQEAHPGCVMWRDSASGWQWWYKGHIDHWRMAHDEVQPVPEILKMMKLMGAL